MPQPKRNMRYPMSAAELEAAVANLITTGRHAGGRRAAQPKAPYFGRFRILGVHGKAPDAAASIDGRDTRLDVRCELHGTTFVATPRGLLNTSSEYSETTCRLCERDAGVGRNFTTLGEVESMIASVRQFDWTLDVDRLPEEARDRARIIGSKERLPLRCRRMRWGSKAPCNTLTTHTWANVLHALSINPDHLHCRGACDSTRKGKARRVDAGALEAALRTRRAGVWRLSRAAQFRMMSEPQWFTHTCGHDVFRLPQQVLDFAREAHLPVGTDADCPYCTQSSPLGCLGQSLPHLAQWVDVVSGGKVTLQEQAFPESAKAPIALRCECGTAYAASLWTLQRNIHYGCPACGQAALSAPRAWRLEDARGVAARRGLRLEGDPGSHTANANILDARGTTTQYASVLALARAMPATADGYGLKAIPPDEARRSGTRYAPEEITYLAAHQSTRSYAALAAHLGRTVGSVKQQFRQQGFRNDQRDHFKRIDEVWDGAFSALTPEACYWAGLLATDGCVTDRGEVKFELAVRDEEVLQAFARYLRFAGKLNYRTVPNVDGRGIYASIRFRSNQIRADLRRHFGIVPRKTRVLPAPKIRDPVLCRAYMVGLIEGDGHVKRDRRNGLMLNFISASPALFDWFVDQVELIIGKEASIRATGKSGIISSVTVWHGDAERLVSVLRDAVSGHMLRKWSTKAISKDQRPTRD